MRVYLQVMIFRTFLACSYKTKYQIPSWIHISLYSSNDKIPPITIEEPKNIQVSSISNVNNDVIERVDPNANFGIISGAPLNLVKRTVRIFRPSRTAMQSGSMQTRKWRLEFDIQQKWENPLMGWTTSADAVQGMDLSFDTAEEALRFA